MNNISKKQLCEWAMAKALKTGADQAQIDLSRTRRVNVGYRDNKVEDLKDVLENRLMLTLYVDGRYGIHTTSDLRQTALEPFIEQAVSTTRYLSQDPHRTLPDPADYPRDMTKDLDVMDPVVHDMTTDRRIDFAKAVYTAAQDSKIPIISARAGFFDGYSESLKICSNGFWGESCSTTFHASADVTVEGRDGRRPEEWNSAHTRFLEDLPAAGDIGSQAAMRAQAKVGQTSIPSGKYDIVVENRCAGRLFYMLFGALQARSLQQKTSFLEGRLNGRIASNNLTVVDDPFVKRGMGSRLFDSEGLEMKKRVIIENGILKSYYVDTYYGRKLGMTPNSSALGNILIRPGDLSQENLMEKMDSGILITGFIGGNSNPVSGDFSFGIQGILIRKGTRIQSVNEMNLSGNTLDLWQSLVSFGNDPYPFSSVQMPSLFFSGADISGA